MAHGEPSEAYPGTVHGSPEPHQRNPFNPARSVEAAPEVRVDKRDLAEGIQPRSPEPTGELQESAPPADPGEASELERLRRENAELRGAFGKFERRMDEKFAEQRLLMQMQSPSRPPGPIQIPLPDGMDPEQEIKVKDLQAFASQLIPNLQADAQTQAIRASWDVTQQEEQEILAAYPLLNQRHEPDRSRLILEAARQRRELKKAEQAAATGATGTTPGSAQHAQPASTQRPTGPTVPHVETRPPAVPDASPPDALAQAQLAYARAKQLPDQKQRLAAMRAARDQWEKAAGLTEEDRRSLGFKIES